MSLKEILEHTVSAYTANFSVISLVSLPLLLCLPLTALLPNYVAYSGIFMRIGSVQNDLTLGGALLIGGIVVASLFIFALTLVGINWTIKEQRTMNKIPYFEKEGLQQKTFTLFCIFILAFLLILAADLFAYNYLGSSYEMAGLVAALAVSLVFLFAPQAVVIDDLRLSRAIPASIGTIAKRPGYFLGLLAVALALLTLNAAVFVTLQNASPLVKYAALVINALVILPVLEAMKVQIYLSKYTALK